MKEKEKIISKTEDMGSIEVPIKRAENTLILRIHLGSATESDGAIWEISHSGGSLVVTVPKRENIPCYIISFEDIIREVMKKEESR